MPFLTWLIAVCRSLSLPVAVCVSALEGDWRCLFVFCLLLSVKVRQFNRARAAPDVSQEEHSHTYSTTSLPTETGFRYTRLSTRHSHTHFDFSPAIFIWNLFFCRPLCTIEFFHSLKFVLCYCLVKTQFCCCCCFFFFQYSYCTVLKISVLGPLTHHCIWIRISVNNSVKNTYT